MANQPIVEIKISPEAIALAKRLNTVPVRAICKAIDIENQTTIGKIVRDRLSYPNTLPPQPDGLRVQTNRLRGSIRPSKTVLSGGTFYSAIGSNVKYAGVHDQGYSGTQQVKAHTRRRYRVSRGKVTFYSNKWTGQTGQLYQTRRRAIKGSDVQVNAHTRNVRFPARRIIQGPIEERLPFYGPAIEQAIKAAWDKQQAM